MVCVWEREREKEPERELPVMFNTTSMSRKVCVCVYSSIGEWVFVRAWWWERERERAREMLYCDLRASLSRCQKDELCELDSSEDRLQRLMPEKLTRRTWTRKKWLECFLYGRNVPLTENIDPLRSKVNMKWATVSASDRLESKQEESQGVKLFLADKERQTHWSRKCRQGAKF